MDIEEKLALIRKPPTEEILTESLLRERLQSGAPLTHYIGFEISGRAHLGTGVMTAMKIRDFQRAGIKTSILLADYHSFLNRKFGGDLDTIRNVARTYFTSVFEALGLSNVRFILASELYDAHYWETVLRIAEKTTLKRMLRCITIMGREEHEGIEAATIFYPAMQVADIFTLGVDIVHAGMDQRKVHVLAIELADTLGYKKPIAVHTHILGSLRGPERMGAFSKMSKSKPETCIFIDDSPTDIMHKCRNAFCPERQIENNPIMEIAEYILYDRFPLTIERPSKYGGSLTFSTVDELKTSYRAGTLHPLDLKNAVAENLIDLLAPVRKYYEQHPEKLSILRGEKTQ